MPYNAGIHKTGSEEKDMTTWVTICETCKREHWSEGDMSLTDGERLTTLVADIKEEYPDIMTRTHPCLMGCSHGCNVTIQADGKMCYTIGNFKPNEMSARAILDYAQLHYESEKGVVSYRDWPENIKGHFISRHPPLSRKL